MKYLTILFVLILISENSISQESYKDNIKSDLSAYSGVYEGELQISMCCEVFEYATGCIVFYFDGNKLNCLYDGIVFDSFEIRNNVLFYTDEYFDGNIFGKFVTGEGEGFLYYFNEADDNRKGYKSFLKKTGGLNIAEEKYLAAEKESKEFNKFVRDFRDAINQNNESGVIEKINFPFLDKRKNYDNPKIYKNSSSMKNILKEFLSVRFYNESEGFRYGDSHPNFPGIYTLQADKMFFYFQKIGSEFKLVFITNVFG